MSRACSQTWTCYKTRIPRRKFMWGFQTRPEVQPLSGRKRPHWTCLFLPAVAWRCMGQHMAAYAMVAFLFVRCWQDSLFRLQLRLVVEGFSTPFKVIWTEWSVCSETVQFLRQTSQKMNHIRIITTPTTQRASNTLYYTENYNHTLQPRITIITFLWNSRVWEASSEMPWRHGALETHKGLL